MHVEEHATVSLCGLAAVVTLETKLVHSESTTQVVHTHTHYDPLSQV